MTTIKLLSTGLIAIAILTTPGAAGEPRINVRVPAYMKLPAEPGGRWIIWNGMPIWFGPSVRGWPGHQCDWGDNPKIC